MCDFKHYKGGTYKLVGEAIHTETEEELAVYYDMDGIVWARPKEMFFGKVVVDGKETDRFTKINKKIWRGEDDLSHPLTNISQYSYFLLAFAWERTDPAKLFAVLLEDLELSTLDALVASFEDETLLLLDFAKEITTYHGKVCSL